MMLQLFEGRKRVVKALEGERGLYDCVGSKYRGGKRKDVASRSEARKVTRQAELKVV